MDERAKRMKIAVTQDGPYTVSGDVPLLRHEIATDEPGESVGWREIGSYDVGYRYQLCRCGHSRSKPFCDGTHSAVGFQGDETAGHNSYVEQAVSIDGEGLLLHDTRKLCAEARFCDRGGGLWNLVRRCDDAGAHALAVEEATLCPSGRFVACDPATREPFEPDIEPSIVAVEDPHLGVSGPLFVRGGIRIRDAAGEPYEQRNRVTLCRCGASRNKPFCDGSHIAAAFKAEE